MASSSKNLLILGLGGIDDPSSPYSRDKVNEMLEVEIERFASIGVHAEFYAIDTENPNLMQEMRQVFKQRQWDAVNIGFGVRGQAEHTGLFENTVNTVLEDIQPPPKFLFALRPNKVFEAGLRVYPEHASAASKAGA